MTLKKTSWDVAQLIRKLIDQLSLDFHSSRLFPEKLSFRFRSHKKTCDCGDFLKVQKTRPRILSTLLLGDINAQETVLQCPSCQQIVFSEQLQSLVPAQGKFGFDVVVKVGQELFLQCRNDFDIQQALREEDNVSISLSEINHLGKKFIVYLALAHQNCHKELKQYMKMQGGYILHLDGTCEGGSPHLMSSIDEISHIVLHNQKMPSENSDYIVPFLQEIKKRYGDPLALVHDMGSGILRSVAEVFPGVRDYICHFHFLKAQGKNLFEQEYHTIRRHLRSYQLSTQLRKVAKGFKRVIDDDDLMRQELYTYLRVKTRDARSKPELNPAVKAYLLVTWVLEASNASHGFGFPFDRVHFDTYDRLRLAYPSLKALKPLVGKGLLPLMLLHKVVADKALESTVTRMAEKVRVFDQLRQAMRIALPEEKRGLNDEGGSDIKTIEKAITQFCQDEEIMRLSKNNPSYKRLLKQIDKFKDKLFADPINVCTPAGNIMIQPQRTNNIMEQFFRSVKKGYRQKSGLSSLNKTLKAMLADTALVKNLTNPEYMKILLKGKSSLEECFADIDIEQVRAKLSDEAEQLKKYPKGMRKVFKIPDLPAVLNVVNKEVEVTQL